MKKILVAIMCLLAFGMSQVVAQQSIIALHHGGQVTLFSGGHLQDAVNTMADGDTLYLSPGLYDGFEMINASNRAIIGAGETTEIRGNVTYHGTSDLTFMGLNISGDLTHNGPITDLYISQCQCNSFILNDAMYNATIMRSYIKGQIKYGGAVITGADGNTFMTCKVYEVYFKFNSLGAFQFINCNIGRSYDSNEESYTTYQNCIVKTAQNGIFENCCLGENFVSTYNGQATSSYDVSPNVLDSTLEPGSAFDATTHLGSDGTQCGIYGGSLPYTLELPTPKISSQSLTVDQVEKKLNVTLTIE